MDSHCIISDKYRFVYFVVPKVACSSIKVALLPLFEDLDPTPYQTSQKNPKSVRMHKLFADSSYQINREQFLQKFEGGQYSDYFKFAFVRNPWDRLVSCWLHKLSTDTSPGLKAPATLAKKVYSGMPFSEFVEVVANTPDSEANIHFKAQSSMVCDGSTEYHGSPHLVDFIGRFENLSGDFGTVAKRIGAERELELGHLMRRNMEARPYTEFYDKELRNVVYERYREDVERFGYSF